jgi:CRISPR/Cas system Type II protein with McrA/HNH and RuvC-like nuclease domain
VIRAELRSWVYARDQGRCAYCQTPEELTVTTFEVDHIVPTSARGKSEQDNLCLTCPACNRYKGARQIAPDPETGENVPLYHPRRQQWSEHFAWRTGSLEVEGLTATGRATAAALRMNRQQALRLRRLWAKIGYLPWSELQGD